MKIPGGNSRLATYGAALYLLKEQNTNEQQFKQSLIEQNINHLIS